ncbi:MAG: hypothetical protein R3326_03330 [Gemmatimonadota bacterium]|nr:hypothetical protein [Gemmatimonadota bacterium]
MTAARDGRTRRGATRALLALVVAAGCVAPARAQEPVEVPVPALLAPEVLLSVGRLVEGELDPPVVLGSAKEGTVEERSLTVYDRIYVPRIVDGRPLAVDDRIRTFRIRRQVIDPVLGVPIGRVLAPTGTAVVDSLAGDVAVARIDEAFAPVLIGDGLERLSPADTTALRAGSIAGVTGYVIAFQGEEELHPPYDIGFLRLPSPNAVGPGAAVEVFEPGQERAGRTLPAERIGRAMVVRVDGDVAAAIFYDLRRSDLDPGDPFRTVVPEP